MNLLAAASFFLLLARVDDSALSVLVLCSVSSVVGTDVPALVELCSVGTVDEGNIIYAQPRIVSLCRYSMSKGFGVWGLG